MGKLRRIGARGDLPEAGREPHELQPPSFGQLLVRFRKATGLTQEELAERATISARAVSAIEREVNRRPQRETFRLLCEALNLSPADRTLFEAAARRRPALVPSLTPLPTVPTNLIVPPTPLVGRAAEIAAACALLRCDDVRALTVTGPGGVGKTRLAIETAATLRADFADGVFFIALASVRDPALVVAAIAQTLSVTEGPGRSLRDSLLVVLAQKRLLLVLDNFEQVIAAGGLVAEILAACAGVNVLVTSRAAIHIQGEREFPVAPLTLPDPRNADLAALSRSAAVQLFAQRAQAIKPGFALTPENAAAVADICTRLDGLPLAIELAAARIRILPPDPLRARLERRLPFLTGGPQDLPTRQRTMRDAIAWSYTLLDPREQHLFRRLTVFAGGCTLEAAEAVCGSPDDEPTAVLDGLQSLADKSLLRIDDPPDSAPRLVMLETIREYGSDLLAASDDCAAVHRRHAAYFLALAEEGETHLVGAAQKEWFERLKADYDNLRAVLVWAREHDDVTAGIRLAAALWRFWFMHGNYTEGRSWLEYNLATIGHDERPRLADVWAKALYGASVLATEQSDYTRAVALIEGGLPYLEQSGDERSAAGLFNILGNIARYQGDYAQAMAHYAASLERYRRFGNDRSVGIALNNMGTVARAQGEYERAMALFEESLAIKRGLSDQRGVGVALFNMGDVARDRAEYDRAKRLIAESVAVFRTLGDKQGLAYALNNLGDVARDQRDLPQATECYEESLALFRGQGDQSSIALLLKNLGDVARLRGDIALALARYREGLRLYVAVGHTLGMTECIEAYALVIFTDGEITRSVRLLSAVAAQRTRRGAPIAIADRPMIDTTISTAHTTLGEQDFTAAWEVGQSLSLQQAVTETLRDQYEYSGTHERHPTSD